MRKRIAWITAVFLVVVAASVVAWSQDEKPGGENRWQGQHPSGMQGRGQFGGPEEHRFRGREFRFGGEGPRGGFEGRRMMGHRGHGGFGGGRGLLGLANNPRVRAYLNLTDAQVTRLHEIGVESEKATIRTRADLELRGIELHELLRADNPDHDVIIGKVQEVSDLRGQMAKQHMETRLTARSVLTPEQIKKVKTFMEGGGRGGPGGPGGERPMDRRGGQGRRPGAPGAPPAPPAHPSNPPATQ
jgi:Spy/CpxP family protein refolding chaperone